MGRKRIKQYLMLLLVIGVVAVVASGNGTFASFNAETVNPGNTFADGTLLLHNTVNGATTCTSESNSSNVNLGTGTNGDQCATFFNNLPLSEADTTLTGSSATVGSTSSITIASVDSNLPIEPGDTLTLTDSNGSNDVTVTSASGTTIGIDWGASPANGGHAYAVGSTVTRKTLTAYADLALENAGTLPASDIKYSATSPGCVSADVGSTATVSSTTAGGAITVSDANGIPTALRQGQTVTLSQNGTSNTYSVATAAAAGAAQFSVTGDPSAYTSGATVTWGPEFSSTAYCDTLQFAIIETGASYGHDSTTKALGCAAGATDSTISTDGLGCNWTGTGALTLGSILTTPTNLTLASGGSGNTNALDAGGTRHFVIGVRLPAVASGNAAQGKSATFGLAWQIDQ